MRKRYATPQSDSCRHLPEGRVGTGHFIRQWRLLFGRGQHAKTLTSGWFSPYHHRWWHRHLTTGCQRIRRFVLKLDLEISAMRNRLSVQQSHSWFINPEQFTGYQTGKMASLFIY